MESYYGPLMWGRRAVACLLGGAVAIVSLAGGGTAWAASHRIEIGESIGPIELGMKRKTVHRVYDHKHENVFHEDTRILTEKYKRGEIDVSYCCGRKKKARVFSIATISPEWTTDKGIGVGSSTLALVANYHVQCHDEEFVCVLTTSTRRATSFYLDTELLFIEGIQVFTTEPAPL